jgi:tRNA nucleotidyltransferase (CCA-adding enzyme)
LSSIFEEICTRVLKKVTPEPGERQRLQDLTWRLIKRTETSAKENNLEVSVRLEGSLAKDTWLSNDVDIDLFMGFSPEVGRKRFEKVALEIARKVAEGHEQKERFAEHPYLEAWIEGTRINLVPFYKISSDRAKRSDWMSATDRTPYHTEFIKKNLGHNLKGDVRLLKRFMKGIEVYGAEIRVGGFSGYMCELLTLQYGSFIKVLEAMAASGETITLDYMKSYRNGNELQRFFSSNFIVVDPIDKRRNVASSVSSRKLNEFIAASRIFLKSPREHFFFPGKIRPFGPDGVISTMDGKGTDIVFIKIGSAGVVSDILWGQLYKTLRSIERYLRQNDFQVLRSSAWSDEANCSLLIFELERNLLSMTKKHLGPPIFKIKESADFLEKYLGSKELVAGPWIEENQWVVQIRRRSMDARVLLERKVKNGGRDIGVGSFIAEAAMRNLEIFVNEEILDFFSSSRDFAVFLTDFLYGRPRWLESDRGNT